MCRTLRVRHVGDARDQPFSLRRGVAKFFDFLDKSAELILRVEGHGPLYSSVAHDKGQLSLKQGTSCLWGGYIGPLEPGRSKGGCLKKKKPNRTERPWSKG
jgi:hypothetical protein